MADRKQVGKIILSVDVEDEKINPAKSVWKDLDRWASNIGSSIEAVHVLQYPQRMIHDERIIGRVNADLKKTVRHAAMKNCTSMKVLFGTTSVKKTVLRLLKHADETEAKAIALVSHGRKWFSRFLMGSFSETLLTMSPIPVLFLSRKSIPTNNKVLFLTDFSRASLASFRMFLNEFAGMTDEVILYHAMEPVFEFIEITTYSAETRKMAVEQMEKLSNIASEYGIKSRWIIEENVLDVSKSVMKVIIREKIPLIGLSTVATRYGMIFIGSVAKKLFRIDKVSAWVCGPEAIKKALKAQPKAIQRTASGAAIRRKKIEEVGGLRL